MSARELAAKKALALALECERSGKPSRRCVEGAAFAAIGGWDRDGLWHFVADFATDADKADVRAWMAS